MPTTSSRRGPVAFLSHTLPPAGGGQAVALGRLLGGIAPAAYRLMTSDRRPTMTSDAVQPSRVPPPWFLRRLRRVDRLQPAVFAAMVAWRARRVARLLERQGCSAIVGCTGGDLVDIPAAVAAARLARIPAFLYYFDDYRHQWRAQGLMWTARTATRLRDTVEMEALAGAAGIVVPNECLADDIRLRTAAPVAIVRNPVDTVAYAAHRGRHERLPATPRRVVYTGAVYEAQGAALRTAARAIDLLRAAGRDVALHLYTPDAPSRLHAQGIPGSVVVHPAVTQADAVGVQVAADVLLLPLSFTSSYPDLIRTSAPGKLGEYLAAGRPLLVHGPADSFPVRFAARHDCAAVCDVDDVGRLAEVLTRLLDDGAWGASLARRAVTASETFALAANRAALCELIGLESDCCSAAHAA
jgi:hypothetical protein